MLKALILDAGGVLIHPLHGDWMIPARYRELLGAYAADIPGEKWREACRAEAEIIREDVFIPDMQEEYKRKLLFLTAVAGRMGWTLSKAELEALAEDFTFNSDRNAWYDDVLAFMESWHGRLRMGILSDAMPSVPPSIRKYPGWKYLDALVISTQVGTAKPDPRMYNAICEQMKLDPEDCLFVDDKVCNLEGAMRVGMRAVQMCRDGLQNWDGDHVHNMEELSRYLEGLI